MGFLAKFVAIVIIAMIVGPWIIGAAIIFGTLKAIHDAD